MASLSGSSAGGINGAAASAKPLPSLLPFSVYFYNGDSAEDGGKFGIQNCFASPYHYPHCSKEGENFDLVLKWDPPPAQVDTSTGNAAINLKCTLTHLLITEPNNCTSPLQAGILFVSDSAPPRVSEYTHFYDQVKNEESFNSVSPELRAANGAVQYFETGALRGEMEILLTLPIDQGKNVKFIHIKLLRGLESNIDMGRIACIGYLQANCSESDGIQITGDDIEELIQSFRVKKVKRKEWRVGVVQEFDDDFLDSLMEHPICLFHPGSKVPESEVAAVRDTLNCLAVKYPLIAYYELNERTLQTSQAETALRTFLLPLKKNQRRKEKEPDIENSTGQGPDESEPDGSDPSALSAQEDVAASADNGIGNSKDEMAGEVAKYNADDSRIHFTLLHCPSQFKSSFTLGSVPDGSESEYERAASEEAPTELLLLTWIEKFCDSVAERTAGRTLLATHSGIHVLDAKNPLSAGDPNGTGTDGEAPRDPFIASLFAFSSQAVAGIVMGSIQVIRPQSIEMWKRELGHPQRGFSLLQTLLAHYWEMNWQKWHEESLGYIPSTMNELMSSGYFAHRECLFMFLFEYATALLIATLQTMLRSYMVTSAPILPPSELADAIRPLIYNLVEQVQKSDSNVLAFWAQDNMKIWRCTDNPTFCHTFPYSSNRSFMEYIQDHLGIRYQNAE